MNEDGLWEKIKWQEITDENQSGSISVASFGSGVIVHDDFTAHYTENGGKSWQQVLYRGINPFLKIGNEAFIRDRRLFVFKRELWITPQIKH